MRNVYIRSEINLVISILLVLLLPSCSKLVEIPAPTDQISDNNVYTSDETAISVLTGIYTTMSQVGNFTGSGSISLLCGLSADELTLYDGATSLSHLAYYQNMLSAIDGIGSEHWSQTYNYIFRCNLALEGVTSSTSLSEAVKRQLHGEAKFLRAFYYFYLVNLFGDVPLPLSTDYKLNILLDRSPQKVVFQQIISDLQDASKLLSKEYLDGNLQHYAGPAERVRPTSWAAVALLARVYLYAGDYINAEIQASTVINNTTMHALSAIGDVFSKNNVEAIWQLQPVINGHNTEDGWILVLPESGPDVFERFMYLNNQLLNSFEVGDQRGHNGNWINSVTANGETYYYPYKYKSGTLDAPLTEYLMVLRLGEQYLIRAEARAYLNNISDAQSDLNIIRARAGLPKTSANDKNSLLSAILHEKQVELFTEWGHRWLDLKRTGNVDKVMTKVTPLKSNGAAWKSYQQLYPLPLSDIKSSPKLLQNRGY